MSSSRSKEADLLSSGQLVEGVCSVVSWVLPFPFLLLLCIDAGLRFSIGGGLVLLFSGCALLCQLISHLIPKDVTVGGNPLEDDCVVSADGSQARGQVIQVWL